MTKRRISAAALIFNVKGEVLMGFKKKYGAWEFPGGKMDDGETIKQTAVRELQEETDLLVPDLHYIGYYDGSEKWLAHLFTGLLTDLKQEPKVMEPDTHSAWKWTEDPRKQREMTKLCKNVCDLGFYDQARKLVTNSLAYEGLVSR